MAKSGQNRQFRATYLNNLNRAPNGWQMGHEVPQYGSMKTSPKVPKYGSSEVNRLLIDC
jgi:hypothetical protein